MCIGTIVFALLFTLLFADNWPKELVLRWVKSGSEFTNEHSRTIVKFERLIAAVQLFAKHLVQHDPSYDSLLNCGLCFLDTRLADAPNVQHSHLSIVFVNFIDESHWFVEGDSGLPGPAFSLCQGIDPQPSVHLI